jgi:hypothetical protein
MTEVRTKKKTTKKRRAAPASTAREANQRWGFEPGFAGAARRGSMDAYTGEHFDADVQAHVIRATECPRQHPEHECWPGDVPIGFRTSWTRRAMATPPATAANPKPAQRMLEMFSGEICFDCYLFMYWRDRQRFFEEHGDLGVGFVRPSHALRQKWNRLAAENPNDALAQIMADNDHSIAAWGDFARAADDLFNSERMALIELAGPMIYAKEIEIDGVKVMEEVENDRKEILDHDDPRRGSRVEQAELLAVVRRLVTKYINARVATP